MPIRLPRKGGSTDVLHMLEALYETYRAVASNPKGMEGSCSTRGSFSVSKPGIPPVCTCRPAK